MEIERRTLLVSGLAAGAGLLVPRAHRDQRLGRPSTATVTAQWAGEALQDSVELSARTSATTSLGTAVSTSPDMSGATVTAGMPSPDGWNRWQVGGLAAGTAYFWQLADTPEGGEPEVIGPVASLRTLKLAGVPCTIRRAVGSCTRNGGAGPVNPAAPRSPSPQRPARARASRLKGPTR